MPKKFFIVFLIYCFLSATAAIQASAYQGPADTITGPENIACKIEALKQEFRNLQKIRRIADRHLNGSMVLTDEQSSATKTRILEILADSSEYLSSHAFTAPVQFLKDQANVYLPETIAAAVNQVITSSTLDLSPQEKACEIISGFTVVGLPVGLALYVLSWLVYAVALLFEEDAPALGLLIYAVSIIMSAVGLYFIL